MNSALSALRCPLCDDLMYQLARPLLFALDPEAAHDLTLATLARTPPSLIAAGACTPTTQPVSLLGLKFRNRVGLAAGLDKNARCIDSLAALGFGFVEVGTVTPKPQSGNPKPRLFRLPDAQALINRFGFNNEGLDVFIANVRKAHWARAHGCVVGLNIGKNAATPIEQADDDYLKGLEAVFAHADYVTVNISSPNTKNLRQLQGENELDHLLARLKERALTLSVQHRRSVPLLVKIAPDLDDAQIDLIAKVLLQRGIDGVIATNTTLARDAVTGMQYASEAGGLSGRPVFEASNRVIRALRERVGPTYPIIGVGGILSGQDAAAKIDAGAQLVQLYTGLIYRGPALVTECVRATSELA